MSSNSRVSAAVRLSLGVTAGFVVLGSGQNALAQEDDAGIEEITVTGTKITVPGVVSSSPIYSVGSDEILMQGQPEIERILRLLPITKPNDGQNVNNGSRGVATIDLRGLGPERNLILIDGKRATPYDINGEIDLQTIPTALIERIDIITGGGSAVYGSDAIAGAINFVMKKDFEGVDFRAYQTQSDKADAENISASLTVGSNMADGRANMVLNVNWGDRESVLFGARPLGLLGIDTKDGSNYAEFLAGDVPQPAPAGCEAPGSVAAGGSTTTMPTRVSIAGGPGLGQFRNDGTIDTNCSVFNFNPVNQYQTPQQRWGGMAAGHFEVNEHLDVYSSLLFSKTNVVQQVAPSGIFGFDWFVPLGNPLMGDQARQFMIDAANVGLAAVDAMGNPAPTICKDTSCQGTNGLFDPNDSDTFSFINWVDTNGDGAVDVGDELDISFRRRTLEFGNRSTRYNSNQFQYVVGARGDIMADWTYDVSFQRGESDRTNVNAGYTNVTAIGFAVRTLDGVTCLNGDPGCVPIDLFGGFGTITPEMVAANSATGIDSRTYKQTIISGSVSGPVAALQLPTADDPVALMFGVETREEVGISTPDECLKQLPSSCLGGFGGNRAPVEGRYEVDEFFTEAYIPLVSGRTGFQELGLELGFRSSDYSLTGSSEAWKAGISWRPIESLLFRAMVQEATRAPNVAEIASPQVQGLEDALIDPCSIINANVVGSPTLGILDPTLNALCLSTGMTQAQVGVIEDIVSGQINNRSGTDFDNLPQPETADTITAGFVWTPDFDFVNNLTLSLDYYDIDISDVIGEFSAQEILDGCYIAGLPEVCDKVVRVGGTLTLVGSGTEAFTQNLDFRRAEGLELSADFGVDMGRFGDLEVTGNINHYLTNERQAASFIPVTDCVGFFGNTCAFPAPETRWIQRTSWYFKEDFMISYLWRHLGEVKVETPQFDSTFPEFRVVDSYDYIDLTGTWQATDEISVSFSIINLFDEDPPVVGNEAGTTASNSGNTFPSSYDVLGTMFTAGIHLRF